MTGRLDLSPRAAFIGIKKVDAKGHVNGLEAHVGKEFLMIKIPPFDETTIEEIPQALDDARREVERLYAEKRKDLEQKLMAILQSDPKLAELGADKYAKRVIRVAEEVADWVADRSPMGLVRRLWPEIEQTAKEILAARGDGQKSTAQGGSKGKGSASR